MGRIGIVGTENSHTDHFLRFLNLEGRHPGHRAVALAGGRTDRNTALAARYGVDEIVGTPEELVGRVDAAIVSTRDGALHREQAVPLLRAGIPVLVDKPLATSVPDAEALVAAAEAAGVPLVSCSALRFVPEMADLVRAVPDGGPLRAVSVVGPADPDSEYSGLFFYGIHHAEAVLEVLGNPPVDGALAVEVFAGDGTTVAHTLVAGVHVTLTFVRPSPDRAVPFHATVTRAGAVVARELTLGADYNAPTLGRFLTAVDSGVAPVGPAGLISPVALLSAVTTSEGLRS